MPSRLFDPGKLSTAVVIEEIRSRVADGGGGFTASRGRALAGTVWAEIRELDSSRRLRAMKTHPDATHAVRIRYRADITAAMRVISGTRTFRLQGPPVDRDGRREWLDLLVKQELD